MKMKCSSRLRSPSITHAQHHNMHCASQNLKLLKPSCVDNDLTAHSDKQKMALLHTISTFGKSFGTQSNHWLPTFCKLINCIVCHKVIRGKISFEMIHVLKPFAMIYLVHP